MSYSHTNSNTNTYTEARARYVMGKIFDDFHAIEYRGFEFLQRNSNWLQKHREDIYYLMVNQVLIRFQIQFFAAGKARAVEYEIRSDGSIYRDSDSGGIDYYEIPRNATLSIVASWNRNKPKVEEEMKKRNWGKGAEYIGGSRIDDGAYSKGGYGATKGRRGEWNQ